MTQKKINEGFILYYEKRKGQFYSLQNNIPQKEGGLELIRKIIDNSAWFL